MDWKDERCHRGRRVWGVSECFRRPVFIFIIKENWICAMTRHHAESKINILLARYFPFDSDVKQWSHPLMIRLHCLWAKSNNRTCGQIECDFNFSSILVVFFSFLSSIFSTIFSSIFRNLVGFRSIFARVSSTWKKTFSGGNKLEQVR